MDAFEPSFIRYWSRKSPKLGLVGEARSKEIGHKREKPGNEGWQVITMVGGSWGQVHRRPPQGSAVARRARERANLGLMQTGPLGSQGVEWSHRTLSTVMFASAVAFKAA